MASPIILKTVVLHDLEVATCTTLNIVNSAGSPALYCNYKLFWKYYAINKKDKDDEHWVSHQRQMRWAV